MIKGSSYKRRDGRWEFRILMGKTSEGKLRRSGSTELTALRPRYLRQVIFRRSPKPQENSSQDTSFIQAAQSLKA